MQYIDHYLKLVAKDNGGCGERLEKHHIVPRSLGGTDDSYNIAYLTIKQHKLAHLLLYKMGHRNQIFSVECFLIDSKNPHSHRYKHKGLRYTRFLRRCISIHRQKVLRDLRYKR